MFEVNNPFSISQSSVVSDLNIHPSRWSCLHCNLSADSLQSRSHSRGNVPSSVSINTGLIMLSRFDFYLHWDVSLSLVSDGIVYFSALQHFIFNADAPILEGMVCDPSRSTGLLIHARFDVQSTMDGRRRLRWSLSSPSRGT